MEFDFAQQEGIRVVSPIVSRLEGQNVDEFKDAVVQNFHAADCVVIDLKHVQTIDSAALAAILSCLRKAKAAGVELKLRGLTPSVGSLLELVRAHRIVHILGKDEL